MNGRALAAGLILALIAACARTPDPVPAGAFRRTDVPIYSNAVLDPARLTGEWRQVGAFTASPGGCAPGFVRFGPPTASGGQAFVPVEADLCLNGQRQTFAGQAQMPFPGRLIPAGAGPGIGAPWWIIWADVDMRSLVIGTPSGEMGFILNRQGALPADRLKAAREILDWNGYNLARLQIY